MSMKRKPTKPGKAGKSIEEVLVQRRLMNASDPTSWPTVGSNQGPRNILSSSVNNADELMGVRKTNVTFNSSMSGSLTSEQVAAIAEEKRQAEIQNKLSSLEPLKEYCTDLQKRCSTLEHQLQGTVRVMQKELKKAKDKAAENLETQKMMLMKDFESALAQKAGPGSSQQSVSQLLNKGGGGGPSPAVAEETTIKKINDSMTELDSKVVHLKEIFRHGDPMVERKKAVTQINAAVRGWLQRQRYASYLRGQREWKWLRCRQIIWLLDMNLGLQSKVDNGINQLKLMHNVSFVYQVYMKWVHITKQALPVRKAMYRAAMDKAQAKDRALMHRIWEAFKAVTVGGRSTKQANANRRLLIDSIREELSAALKAKGEVGVVPDEDVERVLFRRVLKSFLETKRLLTMKNILLNGFWKNVKMARKDMEIALDHNLQVVAGRIFYAWSDWVYMVGAGLDRKRWSQPRQYEIHYNQKRVDNFSRLRLKRHVFYPWKEFFIMQALVRRMLQRQLGRFVKANFEAWRGEARKLRIIRVKAVENWRGYGRLLCLAPFQAWASFVRGVKNVNAERQRIVTSYLRWKWRQRIVIIMKRWRHQALYGRIDGLYTRQMLISSLNEQKLMTSGLEKLLAAQTMEVDECRELSDREIMKRKLLETRLKESQEESQKNRMYGHHAEQEMKRLEGIIESMALLNPRQIAHLKRLQPAFTFKTRKVNIPRDEDDDELFGGEGEFGDGGEGGSPIHSRGAETGSLFGGEDGDHGHDGPLCETCHQPLPQPMSAAEAEQRALEEEFQRQQNAKAVQEASGESKAGEGGTVATVTNSPAQGAPVSLATEAPAGAGSPASPPTKPGPLDISGAASDSRAGTPAGSPVPGSRKRTLSTDSPGPGPGTAAGGGSPASTRPGTMGSGVDTWRNEELFNDGERPNVVSNEDMVLLERVKWLLARFQKQPRNDGVVPYVIPGNEVRTIVEIPPDKPPTPEKKESEDSDEEDEKAKRRKGDIADEMEVTRSAKPKSPPKPKLMTAISWTPGQIVLPERDAILPSRPPAIQDGDDEGAGLRGPYQEPQDIPAVVGVDGQPDTLLPGDPTHEPAGIDTEDTAARLLLGFMNFLEEGDVTTFAPEDRRAWTQEVLMTVHEQKEAETRASLLAAHPEMAESMLPHKEGGDQSDESSHPVRHRHMHHLRMSISQRASAAAAEVIGGAKSWRNALLHLRTMFPGAGNYSGVGVELDAAESALYSRIVDMRNTLNDVVTRQSTKVEIKLEQSRRRAAYRERLILAAKARAEAEEAERLRKEAEEKAEKERLKAEEEAKLAAMRAARAARKLETGASDSDSEEDEDQDQDQDQIDMVNPYAAMLNPSDFGQGDDASKDDAEEGDEEYDDA